MPTNLTDSASYTSQIQVPIDTDPFELDGLVLAYQQLANRAAYLKANALISGETFTGAKTINAGTNALTFSGTTGPFAITRTDGNISAITSSSGNITIDSGNDVTLDAGNNLTSTVQNDATLTVTADISISSGGLALTLPSSAWPTISSRTIAVHAMPFFANPETASEWSMSHDFDGSHYVQENLTAPRLFFHLTPRVGLSVNSVSVRLQSRNLPAAGLPTSMPNAELWAIASNGTTTQLVNTTNDTSANVTVYATWHSIVLTPVSPYVVPEGARLLVVFTGAVHASDAGRLVKVMPPFASVTVTSLRPV